MKLSIIIILALLSTFTAAQNIDVPALPGIPGNMFWVNKPLSAKSEGGKLIIKAGANTDVFRDPSGKYSPDLAPRLVFKPDTDFVLTARIEHPFGNKWDAGALFLQSDSLHWVKFAYEKDYTGARRVVSVVTNGVSDDCNSVELKASSAWFRMAKAGPVVTLYYSTDRKKWFLVRHFRFDATPVTVGFLAQSPTGKENQVTFSEITYEARRIDDPYSPQ